MLQRHACCGAKNGSDNRNGANNFHPRTGRRRRKKEIMKTKIK